eukprot:CAMPEP_0180278348 /NCGR_PEP_ID=MMETSP0988-20121125/7434_1 /TAXON_ID=697907 /ORGANISM="non described non described, Strain CCMP2293" /LENGTH=257 /DNA_ID=CAMNT_0022249887 /DNA_START=293 /DNA_END=1067 /DNA_ORIENTATION=+
MSAAVGKVLPDSLYPSCAYMWVTYMSPRHAGWNALAVGPAGLDSGLRLRDHDGGLLVAAAAAPHDEDDDDDGNHDGRDDDADEHAANARGDGAKDFAKNLNRVLALPLGLVVRRARAIPQFRAGRIIQVHAAVGRGLRTLVRPIATAIAFLVVCSTAGILPGELPSGASFARGSSGVLAFALVRAASRVHRRGGDQREEREGEDVALHRFGGYKLLKGIPVIFLCFGAKSFSVLWWKKFFCALVQKADRTIQFFFLQ